MRSWTQALLQALHCRAIISNSYLELDLQSHRAAGEGFAGEASELLEHMHHRLLVGGAYPNMRLWTQMALRGQARHCCAPISDRKPEIELHSCHAAGAACEDATWTC